MQRTLLLISIISVLCLPSCMSPEARLAKGDTLFAQGRYSQALTHYQIARRKDPAMPGIEDKIRDTQVLLHFERGDTHVQRGQWDRAAKAYENVRRLEPDNAEVDSRLTKLTAARANHHFGRGQTMLAQGQPVAAITEFEQALVFQPDHTRATASLERARQIQRDREQRAELAYQNGLRARDAKRFESALSYFAKALEFNPSHPSAAIEMRGVEASIVDAHVAEGDAAMAARRFADALTAFRKAAARQPNLPGLASRISQAELEAQADALVKDGNRALAQKQWRRAFDKFEAARGLTAEPELFADRLEQARDGFVAELYDAARADERTHRYEEALAGYGTLIEYHATYRDAKALHRDLSHRLAEAETSFEAGLAAQRSCDLVTAQEHFRTCIRALPKYRDAAERLTEVQGSIAMAERLYTRAAEAETAAEFRRARLLYEECLAVAHPFRDASDRLGRLRKRVRRQIELAQYDAAQRAQTMRDLHKARKLLRTCEESHPRHEGTRQRLSDVNAALKRARTAYQDARRAEQQCELVRARDLYTRCLAICTPYQDAASRLQGVATSLRQLHEAQRLDRARKLIAARKLYREVLKRHAQVELAQRRVREIDATCNELERHHQRMLAAQRARQFRQALAAARRIRQRCIGYHDVDVQITVLESEADYADGEAFLAQGRHEAALRSFDRCRKRNRKFRDVGRRVHELHRKLKLPATPGRRRP